MSALKQVCPSVLPILLASVLLCVGCSSLSPSAATFPPETGGGAELSDRGRDALEVSGMILNIIGPLLSDSGSWHH